MTCPFKRCQDQTAHCDGACHGKMPDGAPLTELPELADGIDEGYCLSCQASPNGKCDAGPFCVAMEASHPWAQGKQDAST